MRWREVFAVVCGDCFTVRVVADRPHPERTIWESCATCDARDIASGRAETTHPLYPLAVDFDARTLVTDSRALTQ